MKLTDTDFELFELPARYALDRQALDERWRTLQGQVHPDRHAAHGAAAQRVAMQWSVRVNEAYARLKDPLARATLLCELRGAPIEAENNTAMPRDFLMQQMNWREALGDAADAPAVEALDRDVAEQERHLLQKLGNLLDESGDAAAAAQQVRALMFVKRFRADIARRLDQLDA
jgi:molecular chaperone HscB